jgi:hypothetical protein
MSQSSLSVVPILATPFAVVELPAALQANQAVAQLLARYAAANPVATPASDWLCYRSRDDLLEWNDAAVRQMCGEILRGVWSTVAAVNTFTPEQLKSLSMQARGSFTIIQPNGSVPATNHSLTSWCGIYCLEAPQPSPERSDSGLLRLYESRLATMFADATNSTMRLPFTPGHYSWRAVPGQLAVFPGSLTHEIPLIRSVSPLTLITVRTRFVGPGQEGLSRW